MRRVIEFISLVLDIETKWYGNNIFMIWFYKTLAGIKYSP